MKGGGGGGQLFRGRSETSERVCMKLLDHTCGPSHWLCFECPLFCCPCSVAHAAVQGYETN